MAYVQKQDRTLQRLTTEVVELRAEKLKHIAKLNQYEYYNLIQGELQ